MVGKYRYTTISIPAILWQYGFYATHTHRGLGCYIGLAGLLLASLVGAIIMDSKLVNGFISDLRLHRSDRFSYPSK
jgi:hypothetical protein